MSLSCDFISFKVIWAQSVNPASKIYNGDLKVNYIRIFPSKHRTLFFPWNQHKRYQNECSSFFFTKKRYFEVIVFIKYVIRISRIHNAKWWYWYCPGIWDLSTVYKYSLRPVLLLLAKPTLRNQAGWKPNINCIGIQLLSIADKFFSIKLELLHWTFMNCNFFSDISMLYYLTAICTKVRLQIITV